MSITFYGRRLADGAMIAIPVGQPGWLNLNNGNAVALLGLLGIGDVWSGPEVSLSDARRASIRARALFIRLAGAHTRPASDTQRPGRARSIEGSLDTDGLLARLDAFDAFLSAVADRGAYQIYWG